MDRNQPVSSLSSSSLSSSSLTSSSCLRGGVGRLSSGERVWCKAINVKIGLLLFIINYDCYDYSSWKYDYFYHHSFLFTPFPDPKILQKQKEKLIQEAQVLSSIRSNYVPIFFGICGTVDFPFLVFYFILFFYLNKYRFLFINTYLHVNLRSNILSDIFFLKFRLWNMFPLFHSRESLNLVKTEEGEEGEEKRKRRPWQGVCRCWESGRLSGRCWWMLLWD